MRRRAPASTGAGAPGRRTPRARRLALIASAALVVVMLRADQAPAGGDLDLVVVGDSFTAQSTTQIEDLAGAAGLRTEVHAFGGSALCAWEDQLRRIATEVPERLVLSFAGNALQPCINPTDERRDPYAVADDYARDLAATVALFRAGDTEIYVVEPPVVGDSRLTGNTRAMRAMYRDAAAELPITLIETDPFLSPGGEYHATLACLPHEPCPPDGTVTVRRDDRMHFTPAGGRRYARAVMAALDV